MRIIEGTASCAILLGILSGCTHSESIFSKSTSVQTPSVTGPTIDAGSIPYGMGKAVTLSNGAELYVQNRGGVIVFRAEGTFSKDSFSKMRSNTAYLPENERKEALRKEVEKVFSKLREIRGVGLTQVSEVGYFTFEMPYQADLMAPVKTLHFAQGILVDPVIYDPNTVKSIRAMNPLAEGLTPKIGPRDSTSGFSGLERVHAIDFAKQAEADIGSGIKVNGSSVRVGVTDTGITYNHPTFRSGCDDKTSPRIGYMRDFSKEGRVYFNKGAKFQVSIPEAGSPNQLIVNAQVIVTPKLPNLPAGDDLVDVKDLRIQVSPELNAILTKPGSGAKLGILYEAAFQGDTESVDINGNGTLDDKLYVILIPGPTAAEDVMYLDTSGTADFRNSKPMGDWNRTKNTITSFSEKFGFDFRDDVLPSSKGTDPVQVRSLSIVGFDPGNHGSHVSGIIAGSCTIMNDGPNTLARGVAPEATLLMNRVCANNGGCMATEAIADLAVNAGAEVINMSLGGLNPFNDGYGVQETLINRLTSVNNVLFMISAGNSGPGRQTIGSPSVARLSMSIGASATREMIQRQYEWPGGDPLAPDGSDSTYSDDFLLFFSSRGPTSAGGFKPNITAPGTELSSVQLNAAPGSHGGLDVYWGTSMAAPTATGSYALFLDAIKKYNLKNPQNPLTTNAMVLRDVLIHSARPYDVSRFNPTTGEKLQGQYTWIDQGMGMLDLTSAWKKVFELRDRPISSAVNLDGKAIDLDYQVVIPMKAPNGISYDGSSAELPGVPAFGSGVYLSAFETDTLRQVGISRQLPESLSSSAAAGDLMRQLRTTRDEFKLVTLIYGSDRPWLKAGTLDQLSCAGSDTANLAVLSEGSTIQVAPDGTGKLNVSNAGALNLCIDRKMMQELAPGDHGALVLGYRTVDGKVAAMPSFTVPVYVTIPHQTLAKSTAYDVQETVNSFGVRKNYVTIPVGTTLAKVTLEVPVLKKDPNGLMVPGQTCSGVELMALTGTNVSTPFKTRPEARISNCDSNGAVLDSEDKRKLSLTVNNPTPGIWDLPVFGSYKYIRSQFRIRVDYVVASSSKSEINGGLSALSGAMKLTVQEASVDIAPDMNQSSFELNGLQSSVPSQVKQDGFVLVPGQTGIMRSYADTIKQVTLAIGNSPGNDIDLFITECSNTAKDLNDSTCVQIGASDGPTDTESVTFVPQLNKVYVARVTGSTVKDEGKFVFTETLGLESERGALAIVGNHGVFDINYSMSAPQMSASKILGNDSFKTGKSRAVGSLALKASDGATLSLIPMEIVNQ